LIASSNFFFFHECSFNVKTMLKGHWYQRTHANPHANPWMPQRIEVVPSPVVHLPRGFCNQNFTHHTNRGHLILSLLGFWNEKCMSLLSSIVLTLWANLTKFILKLRCWKFSEIPMAKCWKKQICFLTTLFTYFNVEENLRLANVKAL
jgi:hypothetical protein